MGETPELLKTPCERLLENIDSKLDNLNARLKNLEAFMGQVASLIQVAQGWTGKGAEILGRFETVEATVLETRKLATAAWKESRALRRKAGVTDDEVRGA